MKPHQGVAEALHISLPVMDDSLDSGQIACCASFLGLDLFSFGGEGQ